MSSISSSGEHMDNFCENINFIVQVGQNQQKYFISEQLDLSRFYLKALSIEDMTDYTSLFKDTDVKVFLDIENLTVAECTRYFLEGKQSGCRHQFGVWHYNLNDNDTLVGSVKIGDIHPLSGVSDLVTVLGSSKIWGRGIASAVIRKASELAFEIYGIPKLSGGIHHTNIGSIRSYTRAGWLVEAVLKDHHIDSHGKWNDRVIVSCFNPKIHSVLPKFPLPLPECRVIHSISE